MAGPNQAAYAVAPPPGAPNDPYWESQWALSDTPGIGINLLEGWKYSRGAGVVVAVIDSGIVPHEEFAGRVLPGYDFITDPDVAGDGNGRDSDPTDEGNWLDATATVAGGWDPNCQRDSSDWHGTHVAGTILAAADNRKGIVGIAPEARLLPIRVTGKCGGSERDLVDALRWSAGLEVPGVPINLNPAQIVNLSLGSSMSCSARLQAAVDELSARDVIVVASAGNENTDAGNSSPANCSGTLTVTALNRLGQRSEYANYGYWVDVAAPGGDLNGGILSSTDRGDRVSEGSAYQEMYGTSMAAPHAAGILALARSVDPLISRTDLLTLLLANLAPFALDTTGLGCSIEALCGGGTINAGTFLDALISRNEPIVLTVAPTSMTVGDSAAATVSVNSENVVLTVVTPLVCSVDGGMVTALLRGVCQLAYSADATSVTKGVNGQVTILINGMQPALSVEVSKSIRVEAKALLKVRSQSSAVPKIKSLTPFVCKANASGLVQGLRGGVCKVRVRIKATSIFAGDSVTVSIRVRR
jgi:subtilisin family serine protease